MEMDCPGAASASPVILVTANKQGNRIVSEEEESVFGRLLEKERFSSEKVHLYRMVLGTQDLFLSTSGYQFSYALFGSGHTPLDQDELGVYKIPIRVVACACVWSTMVYSYE